MQVGSHCYVCSSVLAGSIQYAVGAFSRSRAFNNLRPEAEIIALKKLEVEVNLKHLI